MGTTNSARSTHRRHGGRHKSPTSPAVARRRNNWVRPGWARTANRRPRLQAEQGLMPLQLSANEGSWRPARPDDDDDARTSGDSGRPCNGLVPAGRAPVAIETQFGLRATRKGALQRDGQDAVGIGCWRGGQDMAAARIATGGPSVLPKSAWTPAHTEHG